MRWPNAPSPPRRIKISRVLPSNIRDLLVDASDKEGLRDSFGYLGEVNYNAFCSSRIRYGEQDIPTNEFFRKGSLSCMGR